MRRPRSSVRAGALLAIAALALTACAGSTDEPAAEPTSSGPPEPVEIRFSWWGSDTRHELTQQVLDKFTEKYPHITVVPDYTDWNSYFDKLGTSVAGGDAPDVITQEERFLNDYASRGVLADLNELGLDTSKIDENVLQSGTIDDALYGVATGVNAYTIIADPAAFAAAGVEMPDDTTWTWEDYVDIANEISAKTGGTIYGAQDYGFNEPGFSIFARQRGESLYTDRPQARVRRQDPRRLVAVLARPAGRWRSARRRQDGRGRRRRSGAVPRRYRHGCHGVVLDQPADRHHQRLGQGAQAAPRPR